MSTSDLPLRYDILLTGRTLDGAEVETALAGLAQILQLNEAQIAAAFANAPVRIKRNVDAGSAARIRAALEHLNIETDLRPLAQPSSDDPGNQVSVLSEDSGSTDQKISFEIAGNPDHAILTLQMPADGAVDADCSAVVFLDPNIKIRRAGEGNDLGSHYYINRFCSDQPGDVGLAAKLPGEVRRLTVERATMVRRSAYLASSTDLRFPVAGSDTAFSPELRDKFLCCEGPGVIWLSACGGIIQIDLCRPFRCRLDRILAWQGEISFTVSQDDVTLATGLGILWLQTLSEKSLSIWADSLKPI